MQSAAAEGGDDLMRGPSLLRKEEIALQSVMSEDGGFGVVWRGTCRGCPVAIKIPKGQFTQKQLSDFRKEISILSSIYHPNICLFMGAYIGESEVIVVTELMEGDVEHLLRNPQVKLSLHQKTRMALDAARGMAWLHGQSPKVIHRDLKPSNFLYNRSKDSYQIKVCDFGLSDLTGGQYLREKSPKGTPLYMAPEVLMGKRFNEKADVYSFAITVWEILTEQEPFSHVESIDELVRLVCMEQNRPQLPQYWSDSLKQLIVSCWHPDPDERPTFEHVVRAMDDILVDAATPDFAGAVFWKTNFSGREQVPFRLFAERFFNQFSALRGKLPAEDESVPMSGYIGEIKPRAQSSGGSQFGGTVAEREEYLHELRVYLLRLLNVLFAGEHKDADTVSVEHFGRCLAWVGPIENDPFAFFFRVQHLYAQPWFWGMLRTPDATSMLLTKTPGTYLVRFCNTVNLPGYYVLSVVTVQKGNNVVAHIRIKHAAGENYSLERIPGPSYPTLEGLIEACSQKLNLKSGCPGRKYELEFFQSIDDQVQHFRGIWAQHLQRMASATAAMEAAGPPGEDDTAEAMAQSMDGMDLEDYGADPF